MYFKCRIKLKRLLHISVLSFFSKKPLLTLQFGYGVYKHGRTSSVTKDTIIQFGIANLGTICNTIFFNLSTSDDGFNTLGYAAQLSSQHAQAKTIVGRITPVWGVCLWLLRVVDLL